MISFVNVYKRYESGREALKNVSYQLERGEINPDQLQRSVHGWIAHAAQGDTWGLRRSLLKPTIPRTPGKF